MKKTAGLLILVFLLAGMNTYLESKGKPNMTKHMALGQRMAEKNLLPGDFLLRFKDEIGLTADQVSRIEKMHIAFQESVIRRMADVKVKEMKLAVYLKGDKIKRSTAEKMIREISKLKTDTLVDRIYYLLDVKDVLTPEQIKKIDEVKKKMFDRKRRTDFRKRVEDRIKRR